MLARNERKELVVEDEKGASGVVEKFDGVLGQTFVFASIRAINGLGEPCNLVGHGIKWVMIII